MLNVNLRVFFPIWGLMLNFTPVQVLTMINVCLHLTQIIRHLWLTDEHCSDTNTKLTHREYRTAF